MTYLQNRIRNIKNSEIKDIEIDTFKDIIDFNNQLFHRGKISPEEVSKVIKQNIYPSKYQETLNLPLITKFLQSPYLEKKVRGAVELKQLIEDVEPIYPSNRSRLTYINKQFLVRFIMENKILDCLILGENIHPELIKRSTEIVIFLCKNNSFDISIFDLVWNQIHIKHETIAMAFYKFLTAVCE